MVFFVVRKLLSLIMSLVNFCLYSFVLGNKSKIILLWFMSECSALFSSRTVIVLGLTFRSLIHFWFIFVYSMRICFFFLHVAIQCTISSEWSSSADSTFDVISERLSIIWFFSWLCLYLFMCSSFWLHAINFMSLRCVHVCVCMWCVHIYVCIFISFWIKSLWIRSISSVFTFKFYLGVSRVDFTLG